MLRVILAALIMIPFTYAQVQLAGGKTCPAMTPFCPQQSALYQFFLQGSTTAETVGGDFGCLSTHPGEQWLYFEVSTAGNAAFYTESPSVSLFIFNLI